MLTLDEVVPPTRRGGISRAIGFLRPYVFGAASSLYVFTVGWIRSRNRALIVEICRHFGYTYNARETPRLEVIDVDEIAANPAPIDIRAIDSQTGNVSERELICICTLVRAMRPGAIFEFGTFDGRTTLNLAANSPKDSVVHTLDLEPGEATKPVVPLHRHEIRYAVKPESGSRFKGSEVEGRIVQLYGDSGTFDFSPFAGAVDFVFVDGSHAYEYVISDSLNALRMLRNGKGLILWHDYSTWDGVTRALHDLRQHHEAFRDVRWLKGTTIAALRR